MKKITMFYLEECPFCQKAKKAMDELMTENKAYQSLDIEKIEDQLQTTKSPLPPSCKVRPRFDSFGLRGPLPPKKTFGNPPKV